MSQLDQPSPARSGPPAPGQSQTAIAVAAALQRGAWSRFAIPLFAVLAIVFIAVVTLRWDAWVGNATTQTTNDAYVRAELTRLSSRVAGDDFQRVKAGDLLVQIDPADYQARPRSTT